METVAVKRIKKNNLFTNSDFLLLYLGGMVSWFGNNIYYIGLSWFILDKMHSSISLATIMLIGSIPEIVLGPFSGVIVDRLDRKKIIVLMDLIRGVLIFLMAFSLGQTYFFPVLMVGTFLMAVCDSLFSPAVSAAIPNIVKEEDLLQANSFFSVSGNIIKISGLAIGGILIAFIGVKGIFYMNGVSFLISGVSEAFIKTRLKANRQKSEDSSAKSSFFSELRDGILFLFKEKALMSIALLAVILNFFFVGALGVGLPYIVREVLKLGEVRFGLMEVFFPVGALLGAMILSFIPRTKKLYAFIVRGVISLGTILLLVGFAILLCIANVITINLAYWTIGCLIFFIGVINVMINVPVATFFQKLVPDHMRGRFYGFFGTLSQALIPLAYGVSGLILGVWPAYYLLFIGGASIIIVGIGVTKNKKLRQL